jgi:DNA-binding LacI/PurR family transcriptional regulator
MEELGYSPNHAARALRDGRFGSIGLLAYRFDRSGESMTAGAVQRAAEVADYSVTLLSVHDAAANGWAPAAQRLRHQTVDGLIIIRSEGNETDSLSLPRGMPVAVMDSRVHGIYPCVVSDEAHSARMAVKHLLDMGHRGVHHLAGPAGSQPARLRQTAWVECLQEAGIAPPQPIVGDWTAQSGYAAARAFASDPDVTAVVCANDEMAFGLMLGLHEAGIDIPSDISVVGFDDIPLSRFAVPPLTTVRQPFEAMGAALVRMVVDQIGHALPKELPDVIVPSELVMRQSTAPPRR